MAIETKLLMNKGDRARVALRTLLEYIGEDPDREGLRDTPDRVLRSWTEIFAGYQQDASEILSTTFEEVEGYQELVLLKDIPFDSTCEHHMLPFDGRVHIAYLPDDRVVGLSKLARLVDLYARRLQIQERMTQSMAQALMLHLNARGAAVMVEGVHGCMTCRGVRKEGSTMVTVCFEGEFDTSERRQEFYTLIRR